MIRITLVAVCVLALFWSIGGEPVSHAAPDDPVSVQRFSDGSVVAGSASFLMRTDTGVIATLRTSDLAPGNVVTMWFVVFNNPEFCSHGMGGYRCGEGDIEEFGGDPAVGSSVLYGAGRVIPPSGRAYYAARLSVGDVSGALLGSGLTDAAGADVHLVLHDHGPMAPGIVGEMLHTFGANCADAPEGTGTPGTFTCFDPQFAVHESS